MNKILISTFSLFLIVGCGADELNATTTAKTEETPVAPLGTVSGQVLNHDQVPLPESSVRLTVGGKSLTTTTNEDGEFSFVDVPAGSEALVTITKAGHSTARAVTSIPVDAGGFPLANGNAHVGPVVLVALNTTVKFRVFDDEYRPATGARGRIAVDLSNLSLGNGIMSSAWSEAVADASGTIAFENMPDPFSLLLHDNELTVWISPYDRDGDGIPDYEGVTGGGTASMLAVYSDRDLVLSPVAGNSNNLHAEASNVGSLNGTGSKPANNLLKQGEPIRIVFSEVIEPASVVVLLTDETGSESLPVTHTVTAGHTLTIESVQTLSNGAEYNIAVRAASKYGNTWNSTGFFFVGDRANPLPLAIKSISYQETSTLAPFMLDPGETVYVQFNQVLSASAGGLEYVEAFFRNDIDSSSGIGGNTVGEVDNNLKRGFPLSSAEPSAPMQTGPVAPIAVFPLSNSGYTSLFAFRYMGTQPLLPAAVTEITIDFDLLRARTTGVYDTAWSKGVGGSYSDKLLELPAW